MSKNLMKNVIKNVEDIKLSIDCFLVEILENEDNLVLDNKNDDEVIVFDNHFSWKWSRGHKLIIHIVDAENKISIPINELTEYEDDFDRLYTKDYMFTVL